MHIKIRKGNAGIRFGALHALDHTWPVFEICG
jgi:hypothetical protein